MSHSDRVDALLRCLCHPYRRTVVRAVTTVGPMTRRELAEEVASAAPMGDDADSIELSLHHRHIPKLTDADIVEYDPSRELVRPREVTRQVNAVNEIASSVADAL